MHRMLESPGMHFLLGTECHLLSMSTGRERWCFWKLPKSAFSGQCPKHWVRSWSDQKSVNFILNVDYHCDLSFRCSGKEEVPFLVDPNTEASVYESEKIISYLFEYYGADVQKPWFAKHCTSKFNEVLLFLSAASRPLPYVSSRSVLSGISFSSFSVLVYRRILLCAGGCRFEQRPLVSPHNLWNYTEMKVVQNVE